MTFANLTEKELKALKRDVDARLTEVIALRTFTVYSKPKAKTPYSWIAHSDTMGKEKAVALIKHLRKGNTGVNFKYEIRNGLGERLDA
jgi:hypothetical protein